MATVQRSHATERTASAPRPPAPTAPMWSVVHRGGVHGSPQPRRAACPGSWRGFAAQTALVRTIEWLTASRLHSRYRAMLAFDRLPRASRRRRRERRLAALLRQARRRVPLWRERLAHLGPAALADPIASLATLPPLTKDDLREGFPQRLVDPVHSHNTRMVSSSGTADRVSLIHDFDKRDTARAAELRVLHRLLGRPLGGRSVELPPDACNILCGIEDPQAQPVSALLRRALFGADPTAREQARRALRGRLERSALFARTVLPPLAPAPWPDLVAQLDDRLDRIAALRPRLLRGLPLYLVWLAQRAEQRGITLPGLERIAPFGGLLSPHMAARVERAFGARFVNAYGSSELGSVAVGCGHSPFMHLFEDLFIVEIEDGGRPVPDGQPGRLLITDLSNRAMPLLRYAPGDVAIRLRGPCPCGLDTERILVCGREQERLTSAADDAVDAIELLDLAFAHPALINVAYEQRGDRLTARVVTLERGDEICRSLAASLAARFGPRVRVRTTTVLRPEASGKYRTARRSARP
ncbi:MAG: hypothetical protein D6776_02360 [Planctomycetota bacterium]|nr:MAG: hypothetical protein D6776_02360 [Planctomycetota bacterium]